MPQEGPNPNPPPQQPSQPVEPQPPRPNPSEPERRGGDPSPAANLRTQSLHTLTTRLADHYGTIVVEDLDVQAMGRGMGRRAFRRTVAQAGLGRVRPTLAYKCR